MVPSYESTNVVKFELSLATIGCVNSRNGSLPVVDLVVMVSVVLDSGVVVSIVVETSSVVLDSVVDVGAVVDDTRVVVTVVDGST